MKQQIVRLCKDMFHARANGNLVREQSIYTKLRTLCEAGAIDFDNALAGGMAEASKSIAIQMRGIK